MSIFFIHKYNISSCTLMFDRDCQILIEEVVLMAVKQAIARFIIHNSMHNSVYAPEKRRQACI